MMGTRSVIGEQNFVRELFPETFPGVATGADSGEWIYEMREGRDVGRVRLPLSNGDLLRAFERELANYHRLRNGGVSVRHLHATLLEELRIPDPRKFPDCYRIREYPDGTRRIILLWGLDAPEGQCVRPDQAFELMRAPLGVTDPRDPDVVVLRNPGAGRIILNSMLLLFLIGMIVMGTRTYWDRFAKPRQVYEGDPVAWIESVNEGEPWFTEVEVPSSGQIRIAGTALFENHDRRSKPVLLYAAKPGCYRVETTPIGIPHDVSDVRDWNVGDVADQRPVLILTEGEANGVRATPILSCAQSGQAGQNLFLFAPGTQDGIRVQDLEAFDYPAGPTDGENPFVLVLCRDDGSWDHDVAWPGDPQRFAPWPRAAIVRWERVEDAYEAVLEDRGSHDPDGSVTSSSINWGDGNISKVDWSDGHSGPVQFRHRYPLRAYRPEIHYSVVDDDGLASIVPVIIPSGSDPIIPEHSETDPSTVPEQGHLDEIIDLRDSRGNPLVRIRMQRNPASTPERWRYTCQIVPVFGAPFEWISDVTWEILSGAPVPEKVRFRPRLEFEGSGSLAVKVQCRTRKGRVAGHYVFTPPTPNP